MKKKNNPREFNSNVLRTLYTKQIAAYQKLKAVLIWNTVVDIAFKRGLLLKLVHIYVQRCFGIVIPSAPCRIPTSVWMAPLDMCCFECYHSERIRSLLKNGSLSTFCWFNIINQNIFTETHAFVVLNAVFCKVDMKLYC